ncbi:MAG: zinc ABC transporter substrate-binding protein [Alphaproteobacteria bacterium]|nr:zinc ABC transporter substrate-binding protein [Alphaproteobacteria bacterium]
MRYAFILMLAFLAAPYSAMAVQVFACEPEWAALAKEIGGDKVEVFAATHAKQDPHHIRAKPSLIAAMRKAELVVCSGASLEAGWLPVLLQKAGNANAQPGTPGYLLAAEVVPVLEKPERLDRADGDIHPEGNPHVHLNPGNIALVAKELLQRLKTIDAANADAYQAGYDAFSDKWHQATERWQYSAAALKGMPVVVHHRSFTYLLAWLGMREAGSLELKPGIPPSATHLESLLQRFKERPVRVILRTPYEPEDASQWLAEKTGTPALVLPYTIGGDDQSVDLFALFDRTLALLEEARRDQR